MGLVNYLRPAFYLFLLYCAACFILGFVTAVIYVTLDKEAESGVLDNSIALQRSEELDKKERKAREVKLDWWQREVIYQIYPRSFQDSNGDGVGDLRGIQSRLEYLEKLGVKILWLCPFYASPMADFGYDVSDFKAVDPLFGTMEDFDSLVADMHARGMYIVLDFIPNHSSDEHEWFQKSLRSEWPYKDFYVWKPLKANGHQINNWMSVFGVDQSAWTARKERPGEAYLHHYLPAQPDLNYRSPALRKEMENVLQFWLDKGADGFRVDAIVRLVEHASFGDEPQSTEPDARPHRASFLQHTLTLDQPETYNIVRDWVRLLSDFGKRHNRSIFMCLEAKTDLGHTMQYYDIGADFPFNYNLLKLDWTTTPTQLYAMINAWMVEMKGGRWANWVLGSHDNHRVGFRLRGHTDIASVLLLLLPGTPVVYYGDEIGMMNVNIPFNDIVDPAGKRAGPYGYVKYGRDPVRTPMQWDATPNAGFSSNASTWLPVSPDYERFNVAAQLENPNSHVAVFRRLVKLRRHVTLQDSGNLELGTRCGDNEGIASFVRTGQNGESAFLVILSLAKKPTTTKITTRDILSRCFIQQDVNGVVAVVEAGSGTLLPRLFSDSHANL